MPTTATDYSQVEQKRKEAARLLRESGQLSSSAQTFASNVMGKVREARAQRGTSRLAQDVGAATGQLATGGAEIRQRLADVNPLQTDVLTARERARTLGTLGTLATAEAGIQGTIQDVLGAGKEQLVAAAKLKQAEAEAAATEADALLKRIQVEEEKKRQQFEEWVKRQQVAQGWERINRAGEGGGLTPYQQWQITKWLGAEAKDRQQGINEAQSKLADIDKAISLLENDKVRVGKLGGRLLPIEAYFNKDAGDFLRATQKIATEEMFKIGGKVLPAQEIKRLKPYLPVDLTKSKQQLLGDLKKLRESLVRNYSTLLQPTVEVGESGFVPFTPSEQIKSFLEGKGVGNSGSWQIVGIEGD